MARAAASRGDGARDFREYPAENLLVPGVEGGVTAHLPDGAVTSSFEAAEKYQQEACR